MPSSFQADVQQVFQIIVKADPTAPQKLRNEIAQLGAAMDAIAIAGRNAGTSMEQIAKDMLEAQQKVDMLQMALASTSTRFIKDTGAMSRAWIEVARGFEDYSVAGFVGALNNIPGAVYNMGQAFGLAQAPLNALVTAVSLGGTAALIAGKNWTSLMTAMGVSVTDREAKAMEELGKQTRRTADEQDRLNEYKERQSTIDEMSKSLSEVQETQKKGVKEAIRGPDFEKVRDELAASSKDLLSFLDDEAKMAGEARAKREKDLRFGTTPGGGVSERTPEEYAKALENDPALKGLREKERVAFQAAAAKLIGSSATTGNIDYLIAAVAENQARMPKGLLAKLQAATPEGQKEEKELEAEMKLIQKDIMKRVHDMVRAAHKTVADVDITPEVKKVEVGNILRDLDKSGLVGQDVRQGREQLENMLESLTKEIAAKGKVAAGKQASRATTDLVQSITLAVADKSLGRDDQTKVIKDALAKGKDIGLSDDLMERVRDAAERAKEQLNNRAITEEEAAAKKAEAAAKKAGAAIVRGTSHEFRQGIADIRARPDMAPEEKGAALIELRRQLDANRGNLTDVVMRDIRQSIAAAYRAAAQQAQTQQVKAARLGRPTAEIQAAAEPMVQYAVAQGVPAGKARHDVTQNLERLLSQQYNLMQAYMLTEEIMDSYVQKALRDTAELQRRQAMQSGRQRRMGGAGNPSLQQVVRPGN